GLDRAGGDEGLVVGMKAGGRGGKHGPLSASARGKLQAGIWFDGYALAPAFQVVMPRAQGASSTPRPLGSSTDVSGILGGFARSSRAMAVYSVARARLRAQRVGILNHVRAAAGGGAGGEQHEARGEKTLAGEIAAHREII